MPSSKRGFALVIVLWVLAGLTVVAVAVAASLRSSAQGVALLRERVRAEAAFIGTLARIQVLAASGQPARNAFDGPRGRLRADGVRLLVSTPSATAASSVSVAASTSSESLPVEESGDGEWVTVQDLRGLLDLNRPDEKRLESLLLACGSPEDEVRARVDALLDYVDADVLKRLNGAEQFEYAGSALAPPRNARLLSRDELWRVFGWPALRERWRAAGCEGLTSVHGDGLFNRNTAPLALLLADGLDATAAAAFIDARQAGLTDNDLRSSDPSDSSNPFTFVGGGFVGPSMRVVQGSARIEWIVERELQLTPDRDGGPWRLHEVRTLPRPASSAITASVALPAVDFWDPRREQALKDAAARLPFGK